MQQDVAIEKLQLKGQIQILNLVISVLPCKCVRNMLKDRLACQCLPG